MSLQLLACRQNAHIDTQRVKYNDNINMSLVIVFIAIQYQRRRYRLASAALRDHIIQYCTILHPK